MAPRARSLSLSLSSPFSVCFVCSCARVCICCVCFSLCKAAMSATTTFLCNHPFFVHCLPPLWFQLSRIFFSLDSALQGGLIRGE